MRLILSAVAVVLIIVVLCGCCGNGKPPQSQSPGVTKDSNELPEYGAKKKQCKNGKCQ